MEKRELKARHSSSQFSIHSFFDTYSLAAAIVQVEQSLEAATNNRPYKKGPAYDMVYLYTNLQELYVPVIIGKGACTVKPKCKIKVGKEYTQPDMQQYQHFVSRSHFANAWNCFPRHLTAQQYLNPNKAIKKFSAFLSQQEWEQVFKDIIKYALSNEAMSEEYTAYDILCIRMHILRFVEACHLLHVRISQNK